MCYYRMDYYDVTLEMLHIYMQRDKQSLTATNVKACNLFRFYDADSAGFH